MDIKCAQQDMHFAYWGGAAGILCSGSVWLLAGLVMLYTSAWEAALTLFVGGMLIHPLSIVIVKRLGRTGRHRPDNPLRRLVLESTVLLFLGLYVAYLVLQFRAELFFPVMLMVIGVRYLFFATLYGTRSYWAIGGVLIVSGASLLTLTNYIKYAAFMGGVIEVIASLIMFYRFRTPASAVRQA